MNKWMNEWMHNHLSKGKMARERANSIYEYLRYDTKNRMFVDFFGGSLEKVAKCTALLYVL